MDVNLTPTPVNPEHARLDRERTDRQRRLPGFDQDAVAAARVLVIGAGGLGCPVVQALAAAGVGYLHIVDSDSVELSNIQRQPLFGVSDVGEPKAEVAARRALQLCPSLTVETSVRHVDASWILDLFAESAPDCVVDCTDTFASKYLIADAAQVAGLPLVWGTVLRFGGSVSLFEPDGAHLRDIFPTIPQTVESCALAGVLGATTAVVGSLMATEVLKYVSGLPTAAGSLLTYDALSGTCTSFGAVPDPARVVPVDLSAHGVLIVMACGRIFRLSTQEVATSSVILLAVVGFIIIIKLIHPLNRMKTIVVIFNIIGLVISGLLFHSIFLLSKISPITIILTVILSLMLESLMRLFQFITNKLFALFDKFSTKY